jgi:hypothetical protein
MLLILLWYYGCVTVIICIPGSVFPAGNDNTEPNQTNVLLVRAPLALYLIFYLINFFP